MRFADLAERAPSQNGEYSAFSMQTVSVSELSAWDMASWPPPGENLVIVYKPLGLLLPDCPPRATGVIEETTDWWR